MERRVPEETKDEITEEAALEAAREALSDITGNNTPENLRSAHADMKESGSWLGSMVFRVDPPSNRFMNAWNAIPPAMRENFDAPGVLRENANHLVQLIALGKMPDTIAAWKNPELIQRGLELISEDLLRKKRALTEEGYRNLTSTAARKAALDKHHFYLEEAMVAIADILVCVDKRVTAIQKTRTHANSKVKKTIDNREEI